MPPAVAVCDLTKSYGDTQALRGIDFEVATGECVAILGPNGAGKTTCVEILEGFRSADSGEVSVLGMNLAARREAWDTVAHLRSLGKTVLLTTHYMDEAQHLADRVILIVKSTVVADGPPDALGDAHQQLTTIHFRLPPDATIHHIVDLDPTTSTQHLDGGVVNLIVLPLLFLSGTYFPITNSTIRNVAQILPIARLQNAMHAALSPPTYVCDLVKSHCPPGTPAQHLGGPHLVDLAILAAWLIGGVLIAVRYFRWESKVH